MYDGMRAFAGDPMKYRVKNPKYEAATKYGKGRTWLPDYLSPIVRIGSALLEYSPLGIALKECTTSYEPHEIPDCLRPYQRSAVIEAAKWQVGTIVAPPGSGKTYIGCALGKATAFGGRVLILANTKEIAQQWIASGKALDMDLGYVGGGKYRVGPNGTVAMVQTLSRWQPYEISDLATLHRVVIVDECHHVPAETITKIMMHVGCDRRYGLTATPHRADGLSPMLEWIMGPTRYVVTPVDLEKAGVASPVTVRTVETQFEFDVDMIPGKDGKLRADSKSMAKMYQALTADSRRMALIAELLEISLSFRRQTLILCSRVEYAEALAEYLRDIAYIGCKAIHAGLPKAQRESLMSALRNGELRVACATTLADEGLDAPGLSCLILAFPGRSEARTIQRIGRIMRCQEGKPDPICYDLVDGKVGILKNQSYARMRAYKKAGIKVGG